MPLTNNQMKCILILNEIMSFSGFEHFWRHLESFEYTTQNICIEQV